MEGLGVTYILSMFSFHVFMHRITLHIYLILYVRYIYNIVTRLATSMECVGVSLRISFTIISRRMHQVSRHFPSPTLTHNQIRKREIKTCVILCGNVDPSGCKTPRKLAIRLNKHVISLHDLIDHPTTS